MPAPIQKLGTPWEQLQQGYQCWSSRDTPPALQPYEEPVTITIRDYTGVARATSASERIRIPPRTMRSGAQTPRLGLSAAH
ncbi:hypothetical protein EYF80_016455 [Liparis tanakae]|uniref:Uncharacterized protein n=1 Tax=Liparis tanakae TaxID=230148 RepID=A0A4Z2I7N9_9TELE|nr:hypothetical protein EYF80_016455 [Liparis tanakae]